MKAFSGVTSTGLPELSAPGMAKWYVRIAAAGNS